MGNQNSRIESLILGLYRETLLDLFDSIYPFADQLPAYRLRCEIDNDWRYVETRTLAEGLGFLTKVLPTLGRYLDDKLSGKEPPLPEGIKVQFLRSAFDLVNLFVLECDSSTERASFIRRLRTFFYLAYKLELPSSPELNDLKIKEFLETEREVSEFTLPVDNRWIETARDVLDLIVGEFDPSEDVFPRHGPGSVATGEKGDGKWVFTHLYESLHQKYPYYLFMYGLRSNGRALHLASRIERYREMKREPFPIAKLCLVPKDSRGPRIISSEPLELQFMQQGVARRLMTHLEVNTKFCEHEKQCSCESHINFIDQSTNANIALSSSRTGEFATLDLSEASDRVSRLLFEAVWLESQVPYFNALRSHATTLPSGEVVVLEKFAPMGSAICFPVESAIFYALCVAAIRETGAPLDVASRSVYVYGDDLVVPVKYYNTVVKVLEMHGLKVNMNKSFASGYFRESCGCDAWLGHVVTPIRIRKLPSEDPRSGSELSAWTAYAGHFFGLGMDRSGNYCKQLVERTLGGILPFTECDNGYLSVVHPTLITPLNEYCKVRWDVELSLPTAKVWVCSCKPETSLLDDYERLHRDLLVHGEFVNPDRVVGKSPTLISLRRRGLRSFSLFDWLLSA